ncbi:MAG: sodium:solute symporter family protein [Clostridiales Family XIII bacterium]|nr:sodium:solute symporter family protein [Clostridiales Family XIII bacterium]
MVQIVIILAYFALTVFIGIRATKKSDSSTSFHGAQLGVVMIVAASTGEWLGGTSTTGVSEYGFEYGISGAWYTVANGIGVLFLAIFFAKLYRSLDTVTVPGILAHFIGKDARFVASILLIFVMIVVGSSQVIAAGTLGVEILGLPFWASVLILGVVFIIYTIAGGMNAVGSTNVVHLVCMYGGVVLALVVALKGLGGGSELTADLPQEPYFQPMGIGVSKATSWIIASLLGACTAQAGLQPVLAAKDVKTARKASFITAAVVAPFGVFTVLLGMIAKVQYGPEIEAMGGGKFALPVLMMHMHPAIGGVVLASIFAAILSTVSPIILASGTMFTKDVMLRKLKDQDDKKVLYVSRASTAVAGLVCIALAVIFYYQKAKILDLVYFAYTIRGALFIILLYGIYWKRLSEKGAIASMLLTAVVGVFWVAWNTVTGSFPINPNISETYAAVFTAAIATPVFTLIFPKAIESEK